MMTDACLVAPARPAACLPTHAHNVKDESVARFTAAKCIDECAYRNRRRRCKTMGVLALGVVASLLAACSTTPPATPAAPPPARDVGSETPQAAPEQKEPASPSAPPVETSQAEAAVAPPPADATPTGAPENPQPSEAPQGPPPNPADVPPPPVSPIPTEGSAQDNMLESARRSVRSSTVWLARGVDSWFGDEPFSKGGEVKDGRLSVGFFKRQGESIDTRVRFNARVRLPNAERRAYLFIGRDNEQEVVSDTPAAFSRQDRLLAEERQDRSFFTGLGYSLREAVDLRLGFHAFKPYAQARYHQPWVLSERDLVEFRQTFFWQVSDRFGSTTALSYEHAVSSSFALRWLTASTITQKTKKNDWSSILGAYKTFGQQRLLSAELIASGRLGNPVAISEYGPQLKWLQPIYRDWLLGELLVGYYFPRSDESVERGRRWAVGYATTMRF
jgi:hypothetical protein